MGLFSRKSSKAAKAKEAEAAPKEEPAAKDNVVDLEAARVEKDPGIEIAKCIEFVQKFPLGPVALSPDFSSGKVQDTVLLGYQFDKKRAYVAKKLSFNADDPKELEIECEDEKHKLKRVHEFYFMVAIVQVPEADAKPEGEAEGGEGEASGNEDTAATPDRPLSFPRGRELDIRGFPPDSQITQCRALVKKRVALRRGVYEGHQVMLLEPRFDTIVHPNQRSSPRIEVKVPVGILLGAEGAERLEAHLMDFSETMHRLEFTEPEAANEALELGKEIRFAVEPEGGEKEQLSGTIVKRREGVIVAELKMLTQDGIDNAMTPLLALSLKTRLMQYQS